MNRNKQDNNKITPPTLLSAVSPLAAGGCPIEQAVNDSHLKHTHNDCTNTPVTVSPY